MIAEIRPADAPPGIAAIYADIQAASGVPMINLIWRHVASLPGVLEWAWTAVRPLVASEQMAAARQRIAHSAALPALTPRLRADWAAAGVDDAALPDLAKMMAAYVRGNLTNIVALTALRMRLDNPALPAAVPTPAPPPPRAAPLPPLPRIEALPPALAGTVSALAARHDGTGDGVIPSLYLALAPWPGLLAALPDWLGPLYEPEVLRRMRTRVVQSAEAEAQSLLPAFGPTPSGVAAMRPALDRFTRLVIPDLIPICLALNGILPAA